MTRKKKTSQIDERSLAEDKLRKKAVRRGYMRRFFPYFLILLLSIGVAFFGSKDKNDTQNALMNMETISSNNYTASADQVSEFFIVSEVASSIDLPTAAVVNTNYNSLTQANEINKATATTEKMEKPVIPTSCGTGVVVYVAKAGDTVASVASEYSSCGVNEEMIRWSNSMKASANFEAGKTYYLPSSIGFVYTTKTDDTINAIASKYKAEAERIQTTNQLDNVGLDEKLQKDLKLFIPNGELPDTERPDYVAPKRTTSTVNKSYAYRTYWTSSNPMPWGWCTWYAWARRAAMGGNMTLPGGLGNASTWDNTLAGTYYVDYTPAAGAVFQTDSGYYGHVGIVESVNSDGTINVSDMNGISGWGRVGYATWPKSKWQGFKFIHGRK